MATSKTPPLFFPTEDKRGPWGVDTIGDDWYAIHKDTLKAVRIGPVGAKRTNHFERAKAEAARRNAALPPDLNDEATAARIGYAIAGMLGLKFPKRGHMGGRVRTAWGTKTPAGLARTMARVMAGEKLS